MELIIRTPYGNTYNVDDKGRVVQYSNGLNKRDSSDKEKGTWRITGAWFYKGVTQYTSFSDLIEIARLPFKEQSEKLKLKNGKPRYGLTDIDHGSERLIGNKEYHGIASLSITQ